MVVERGDGVRRKEVVVGAHEQRRRRRQVAALVVDVMAIMVESGNMKNVERKKKSLNGDGRVMETRNERIII